MERVAACGLGIRSNMWCACASSFGTTAKMQGPSFFLKRCRGLLLCTPCSHRHSPSSRPAIYYARIARGAPIDRSLEKQRPSHLQVPVARPCPHAYREETTDAGAHGGTLWPTSRPRQPPRNGKADEAVAVAERSLRVLLGRGRRAAGPAQHTARRRRAARTNHGHRTGEE